MVEIGQVVSNKKIFKWFFAYLCLIWIISQNRQNFKIHKKCSSLCLYSPNLGTFCLKIKQFWPFEEISIFSNGGHLGWRAWLLDITIKGNPLRMIQAKFGLNWPSGFRGEDFWKGLQMDDECQVMATGELIEVIETIILEKILPYMAVYYLHLCIICTPFWLPKSWRGEPSSGI